MVLASMASRMRSATSSCPRGMYGCTICRSTTTTSSLRPRGCLRSRRSSSMPVKLAPRIKTSVMSSIVVVTEHHDLVAHAGRELLGDEALGEASAVANAAVHQHELLALEFLDVLDPLVDVRVAV